MRNDIAITAKLALLDAATDILHWIQLAERQQKEIPDSDHCPYAPTDNGIKRSRQVYSQVYEAIGAISQWQHDANQQDHSHPALRATKQ